MKGPLCQYKDIFGKPGEGAHEKRVMGMAAVDLYGTIGFAILISWFTKFTFTNTLIFMIILSVFMHWLFCVPTALTTRLGLV